jgi:hypothetical protein
MCRQPSAVSVSDDASGCIIVGDFEVHLFVPCWLLAWSWKVHDFCLGFLVSSPVSAVNGEPKFLEMPADKFFFVHDDEHSIVHVERFEVIKYASFCRVFHFFVEIRKILWLAICVVAVPSKVGFGELPFVVKGCDHCLYDVYKEDGSQVVALFHTARTHE